MSVSIGSGSSRGRSLTRMVGKRRKRGATPRSLSSLTRGADRQDGKHRRLWSYPQGLTTYFDPFPTSMRAILRYSEVFGADPGAGGTAHYLWRAGSIYDPNFSGAGHQPYGHDTYATIYNHYRVIKAVAKVTWTQVSGPALVGITMTDDGSVNTTYDTVREVKPTKYACVTTSEMSSLTQTYIAADVFRADTGSKTTALMGTNPDDEYFFDVWAQSPTGALGDVGGLFGVINIVYYVEFSELKDLGGS